MRTHRKWGGPGPALGRPAVDPGGWIFRVRDQPWRYLGVTAFKLGELVRQGVDIRPFIRAYTSLGFTTFRWMANKPPVSGLDPGWTTPPVEIALQTFQILAEERCWGEVTLFGSDCDQSFAPSWIDALRDQCPNALVEGVNEPGHQGQWGSTDPIDTLVLSRLGDLPYASGNYDPALPCRGTYGTIHTERAPDPCDTARKGKAVQEMHGAARAFPWVGDEPAKPQDYAYRADCALALFAIYGLFGAGGTFHTLGGQFGQLPTDQELPCAQAAIQGLTAFPPDAAAAGTYFHDTDEEAKTGALRVYRGGPDLRYGVRVCPKDGSPVLIGV